MKFALGNTNTRKQFPELYKWHILWVDLWKWKHVKRLFRRCWWCGEIRFISAFSLHRFLWWKLSIKLIMIVGKLYKLCTLWLVYNIHKLIIDPIKLNHCSYFVCIFVVNFRLLVPDIYGKSKEADQSFCVTPAESWFNKKTHIKR